MFVEKKILKFVKIGYLRFKIKRSFCWLFKMFYSLFCSHHGSTFGINNESSVPLNDSKRKQWSSCHVLSPVDSPNSNQPITEQKKLNQPIGRLQRLNPDGTQVIQITRPEDGPVGFFIAKGNAKYGKGECLVVSN